MDLSKLTTSEKIRLALDPQTSLETLTLLASDESIDVRGRVAQNPNTPQETLTILADDRYCYIRHYVAINPNTQQYIKDYLDYIKDYINARYFMEDYGSK